MCNHGMSIHSTNHGLFNLNQKIDYLYLLLPPYPKGYILKEWKGGNVLTANRFHN